MWVGVQSFCESAVLFYIKGLYILSLGVGGWTLSVSPWSAALAFHVSVSCRPVLGDTAQPMSVKLLHEMALGIHLMPPHDVIAAKLWGNLRNRQSSSLCLCWGRR